MTYFSAYATVDENTLYIQGGANVLNPSLLYSQFFSLDLSRSWNTSNPPWVEVTATGIPARLKTAFHSMSLSKDSRTLTFWDMHTSPPYSVNYHLDTKKWETLPAPPIEEPFVGKFCKAATDPTTDHVYIPGGFGTSLLAYDPSSKASSTVPMPPGGSSMTWSMYTFAWNDVRRSFLYFGGYESPAQSYFYEYTPAAVTPWTALDSYGPVPPQVADSCMVSAYNGAKMIVFGGRSSGQVSGMLYILDVATMTWTQGPSSQPRMAAACSVSGDNFVVWGGVSWDNTPARVLSTLTPDVYNMYTAQWTTNFIAKKDTPPRPTTTQPPESGTGTGTGRQGGGDEGFGRTVTGTGGFKTVTGVPGVGGPDTGPGTSKSSNAAIIGGALGGGVVIIAIAGVLVVFWRRKRKSSQRRKSLPKEFWNI
ncbi:hypothetical protein BGZ96_001504 [Linnemannia gamsii]|uniref:Kelch repeat protein n=1 Tax=Linnemannia gamsii TaxID=64522 RepID=A0ABQ7JME5_9FUNG|nr:hypothetical protein BGZ96_001504 [Linnemannia gamsii]